ncbi:MAG: DUF5666 domain-containing protein [Caldilineaceae bacterium]
MEAPTQQNWTVHTIVLSIIISTLCTLLIWSGLIARASEANLTGHIDSMPSGTLEGSWVVEGVNFIANSNTDFRQDKGSFAVGVCVEVEYAGSSQPYTATKIASKNADDCSVSSTPTASVTTTETPSGTPSVTTTVTPNSTPSPSGSEQEAYGRIESMPGSGFVGTWVIAGVTYQAPSNAEFKQRNGPLVVGACAKVHYFTNTSPLTIRELESRSASDCNGASQTPGATPGSTPEDETEIYGRVESMPSGLVGNWVINGVAYNADSSTEFKQEHGSFAMGICVKVHLPTTGSSATMREIETEQEYHCGGSDGGSAEGELYGRLQSFPANRIGDWNIGGMTFVASSSTGFKERNGAFAVGVTVKVHFTVDSNGVHQAREIETKFANDDDGSDDDGNGSHEGAEGHAYGIIDSFPADLKGAWSVSGIPYSTSDSTTFSQSDGSFAVGVQVKVEYYLDSNKNRVARKIESTNDNGGASSATHYKVFGYVNQMPANGFVGTWMADNNAFVADSSAQFKENNGLLGLGAYVAIEYSIQDGHNQVHEIETHVPPGAGANSLIGQIDDKGGALVSAKVSAAVWNISGRNYTVTPATNLNDALSGLGVGETVWVNSYTAPDGSEVATLIRGITLVETIYLPTIMQ